MSLGSVLHDHDDEAVRRAQHLIDSDLGGDLRVDALARAVGVSSRTLGRRFLDSVGQTPQAYIQARRVDTARRMLETSDTPVDGIRRRVGYSDATAFRRAFRHHAGLSPTDYRRRFGWPSAAPNGQPD